MLGLSLSSICDCNIHLFLIFWKLKVQKVILFFQNPVDPKTDLKVTLTSPYPNRISEDEDYGLKEFLSTSRCGVWESRGGTRAFGLTALFDL